MTETLKIGAHESVTIIRSDAECLELEARYAPHGNPPPTHLHPAHDERFEVVEGELSVDLGSRSERFGPDEHFAVPRGEVHRMWNAGDVDVVVRWTSTPAMGAEAWFRGLATLQQATADAGKSGPDLLAFGAHALAHRDTFRLVVKGSPLLGSLAVGCLGGLGTVLGRRPSSP